MLKEISIGEIENILIGQTEDTIGATGCTVFVSREGMPAGLDVRGGGPASRESELLKQLPMLRLFMPLCWQGEVHTVWMPLAG